MQRGEDIKSYTKDTLTAFFEKVGKDPIEYISVLLDVPINIVSSLIEKAPWSDWKKLFEIYSKNPALLRRVARVNKERIFFFYSIVGDTNELKTNIKNFLEYATIFDSIREFLSVLIQDDVVDSTAPDPPAHLKNVKAGKSAAKSNDKNKVEL